ncbi:tripartite tricarboxylate transporter permease [Streptomyces marispadix]|uniref:Tripartite tricarboxylate transporter permease n=1 Tax=Streptomyces marispadix TaxID=2922868 RepID=A0ABS9SZB2_9ACTN|nr:tripartite tricarboxylate transporter permease [Streptomyces marispadix]MCH6161613.1 tripartite tricarboxylate transporter permease [Streptomyces marispadix]
MLEAAFSALGNLFALSNLIFLLLGVASGLVIGMIPGLGGTGAVAMLLPFVFALDPTQALALIIGAVAVVHTSDTIASVLLGIPGSASASVLMLDGHQMAKQGQGARALSVAFLSSMIGGLLGALGLTLSIPVARPLVLSFGAPELFMLTLLGVSLTAVLSRGNMLKGLLAGAFGLLLGGIGAAPAAADYRFTFGSLFLSEGLDLVAVALGIFGIAEIVTLVGSRSSVATGSGLGSGWRTGLRDVMHHWRHVLRGALVGMWAGVLPGLGATAGTWMAYGQARATTRKEPKKTFGKGDPRGIIAPESANNSVEAGDLIPTLLFGIPGGAPAALLLGALLAFNIEPGPRIITKDLDIVYTIIWSFALASILGAAACFLLSKPLAKLSFLRFPVLAGGLVVVLFTAGFQESEQIALLQIMLLLGAVGWVMKACGIPRAPFLIGFVLSLPMERYYFLTANLYAFDQWIVRPWVLVLFGVLVVPTVFSLVKKVRARRARDRAADGAEGAGAAGPAELPDDDEGEGGPTPPRIWDVAVPAVFLAVFVAAFLISRGYSSQARLVPGLVTVVGAVMAAGALVSGIRALRGAGPREPSEREAWAAEWRAVLRSFGWLAGFVALTYVLGVLLAALVFLPLFLRRVAEMHWPAIALYTVGTTGVLAALAAFADIALPIGYLTPVGLL